VSGTRAAESLGNYVHARRAGNLLFLAGLGPRSRGSRSIPGVVLAPDGSVADYDIAAQVRAAFENVRIVLSEHGARWEDVVDVTVFMTDLRRDWAAYNRAWAELFPASGPQPTRTTVEVSRLPQGGDAPINFEVKVVAVVP
jgi:2-aminomuconate deaminase